MSKSDIRGSDIKGPCQRFKVTGSNIEVQIKGSISKVQIKFNIKGSPAKVSKSHSSRSKGHNESLKVKVQFIRFPSLVLKRS